MTAAKRQRKRIVLPDFRPNAGIQAEYRAELNRLLRSARNEVMATVRNNWGMANVEPDLLPDVRPVAMDGKNDALAKLVDQVMSAWLQRLGDLPQVIARAFVGKTAGTYTRNMGAALKKAGFTVDLQLTDYTKQAMRASVGVNVGLIKSIPGEYLADVQKYVWEAVEGGFDLKVLTDNLDHAYHIGRNRCKLIARDQANKAHAAMEQARRQELGIKKAIWRHSAAAREPRESHVKANNKEFDVSKGMYLDGEWVLPGQKINCGCTSRSVIEW